MCKDGLSILDVMHVENILNFGGNIKAVHCSAENEYATLRQAQGEMNALTSDPKYNRNSRRHQDYKLAYEENHKVLLKFMETPVFEKWVQGKSGKERT